MGATLTEKARYCAGKSQLEFFLSNQYPMWRIVAVKSVRKILLNLNSFYADILTDVMCPDSIDNTLATEIHIGWLYEAMAQGEQAIEDLFSLLKNSTDIPYFAKRVVNYNAAEIKKYIWNFKVDDIQYMMEQFQLPYFSIDDSQAWEDHIDVFEHYRESVLLMQRYLKKLIEFHKHYYLDYCQYKHGMAVALRPYGNAIAPTESNSLVGTLMTFDNYQVGKRRQSGMLPSLALCITPETHPYITKLYNEENLLHFSMHQVDIENVLAVTEMAYTLESVVRANLIKRSQITDEDMIHEWAFPLEDYAKHMVIGFPVDK